MPDHRREKPLCQTFSNPPLTPEHQGPPARSGALSSAAESVLPPVLLGQTGVSGVIDAVSFLGLWCIVLGTQDAKKRKSWYANIPVGILGRKNLDYDPCFHFGAPWQCPA